MYHRYDGGGVTVDGPAVMVRKNFKRSPYPSVAAGTWTMSAVPPST